MKFSRVLPVWILVFSFCLLPLRAQMTAFGPNEGLSQSTVSDIVQDRNGLLWISTGNGVNRYDGSGFSQVPVHGMSNRGMKYSAAIGRMHFTGKNRVWIGGVPGLYSTRSSGQELFSETEKIGTQASGNTAVLSGAGDVVWVSNREGLIQEINTITDKVTAIDLKKNHITMQPVTRWIPFGTMVYCELFDSVLILDKYGKKKIAGFRTGIVISTHVLQFSDSMWFLCRSGEPLKVFYPGKLQLKENPFPEVFDGPVPHMIRVDNSIIYVKGINELWQCDFVNGIFTNNRRLFSKYAEEFGEFVITKLFADRSGQLWVGTDGKGLFRFNIAKNRLHNPSELVTQSGLDHDVFIKAFCNTSNGDILVSTLNDGIRKYDRNFRYIEMFSDHFSQLRSQQGGALYRDRNGRIWISQNESIWIYSENQGTLIETPVMDKYEGQPFSVSAFCETRDGQLFCAASTGIYEYNKDLNFWKCIRNHGTRMLTMYADNYGRIWTSKYWGALEVYNKNNFNINSTPIRSFFNSDNTRAVVFDSVRRVFLAATEDGIREISMDLKPGKQYSGASGMRDAFVYALIIDRHGRYWASTNNGIHSIDPRTGVVRYFNIADGAQSREFNSAASLISASGDLVFGGIKGFVFFNSDDILRPVTLPEVHLLGALFINQEKNEKIPYQGGVSILPTGFDHAEISFLLPDFADPDAVKYYYRFQDQKNWIYLGHRNRIYLSKLAPGNYKLMVKGIDHNGFESAEKMLVAFTVKSFFYQTIWFWILIIVFGGFVVFLITRYFFQQKLRLARAETRRIAEIQNLRTSISRELHDNLGASLSRVSLMTHRLREMPDQSDAGATISHISGIAGEMNRQLRNIVWSMSQEYDNLESLQSYIRQYANTFLEENGIEPVLKITNETPELTLTPDVRQSLFSVVKEALNNTAKYSNTQVAELHFTVQKNQSFELIIRDNGAGFDTTVEKQFANGLKNIRLRMREQGFDCELISSPGSGTEWRITGAFGKKHLQ